MSVIIAICLILFAIAAGLYKPVTRLFQMPVFGMDKDLIVINKAIAVLILLTLVLGFFLQVIGLMNLGFRNDLGAILTISGTVLFASALIGLILFSNRLKQ